MRLGILCISVEYCDFAFIGFEYLCTPCIFAFDRGGDWVYVVDEGLGRVHVKNGSTQTKNTCCLSCFAVLHLFVMDDHDSIGTNSIVDDLTAARPPRIRVQ